MERPNKSIIIALAASSLLLFPACRNDETVVGGAATETIAPAEPQPAPTGTDAMTQTVDIEQGRSEAEGGVQSTGTDMTDTITTTAAATGTVAPPTTTTR